MAKHMLIFINQACRLIKFRPPNMNFVFKTLEEILIHLNLILFQIFPLQHPETALTFCHRYGYISHFIFYSVIIFQFQLDRTGSGRQITNVFAAGKTIVFIDC